MDKNLEEAPAQAVNLDAEATRGCCVQTNDSISNETLTLGFSERDCTNKLGPASKYVEPWVISWDQFCKTLEKPTIRTKEGSYFVISQCKNNQRSDTNLTYPLQGFVLDGDSTIDSDTGEVKEGAPPPEQVHDVLKQLNIRHVVYSSHSNVTKGHRYRAFIPAKIDSKKEFHASRKFVIAELHKRNLMLVNVAENKRLSQPWYLPRTTTQTINDYYFATHDTQRQFPKQIVIPEPPKSPALPLPDLSKLNPNLPINNYNQSHDIQQVINLLIKHGYKHGDVGTYNGKPDCHMMAPDSTTKGAGVHIFINKSTGEPWVTSFHGDHDPLAKDEKGNDAFGVYKILEHGGDQQKATKQWKQEMKNPIVPPPPTATNIQDPSNSVTNLALNKIYGIARYAGKTVIVYRYKGKTVYQSIPDAVNYHSNKPAKDAVGNPITNQNGGRINELRHWLAWLGRREYSNVVFEPDKDLILTDELPKGEEYNVYAGLAVTPKAGDCNRITKHIRTVLCNDNEELYAYVLNWIARMVQKPAEPAQTAILLHSKEGTGKNTITDMMVDWYGENGKTLGTEDIVGRFNDHLGHLVFGAVNESLWGGKGEGILKQLITEPTQFVERKGFPKFTVKNCIHLWFNANAGHALPVTSSDRRFVCLDVSEKHKNDVAYFDPLRKQIKGNGSAAFLHEMLNRNIENYNPAKRPQVFSQSRLTNQLNSLRPTERWIYEILFDGEIVSGNIPFLTLNEWTKKGLFVSTARLFMAYSEWCNQNGLKAGFRDTVVKEITNMLKLSRTRPTINGVRAWGYDLPDLGSCRQKFDACTEMIVEWDELTVGQCPPSFL
jgi:hypothetical protein